MKDSCGRYFDSETGKHYNYFRDYDPAIGRYIESDPIGLDGGLNPFAYADQNPLTFTDATGESPISLGARLLVAGGTAALNACRKVKGCAAALDRAEEFCKDVKCELKRERADHNFGDKTNPRYCEHYRLTCWRSRPNKEQIFSSQFALPGRCFPNPRKNLGGD